MLGLPIDSVAKRACEVAALAGGGFVLGIEYTGRIATPETLLEAPAWIAQAQAMKWTAVLLVAIGAFGWMVVDYIERRTT